MKKDMLHKPNQTIMINSGDISSTQRKSYNILLHTAQAILKENPNQTEFSIPIHQLLEKTGIGNNNHKRLDEDLKALQDVKIEMVKDNGDWRNIYLVSEVGRENGNIVFDFSNTIRKALINNDYYTTLDLLIIKRLTGKYSVILYEMAIRYRKVEIPELTVEEFKKLTGTESYKNFADIKRFCINPAIKEIEEETDIKMEYSTKSIGRKTVSIKFTVKLKENNLSPVIMEYTLESLELFNLLPAQEQIDSRKIEFENLLKKHSFKYLKADIEYSKKKKPKEFWSYFIKSVNTGHYSKGEIEKMENRKLFEIKQTVEIEEEKFEPKIKIEDLTGTEREYAEKIQEMLKKNN